MQIIPSPRILSRITASASALLWLSPAHGHIAVQIRGSARLEVDVSSTRDGGEVVVRGRLRDELGEPIVGAKLRVDPVDQEALSLPPPSPCMNASAASSEPQKQGLTTSTGGQFCATYARVKTTPKAALRVTFDGSEEYSSTSTTAAIDDGRSTLVADLHPASQLLSLDAKDLTIAAKVEPLASSVVPKTTPIWLDVSLLAADAGKLEDHRLQRLQVEVGTQFRLTVSTERLGHPGPAELVFSFEGDGTYEPLRSRHPVLRTVNVTPVVLDWPSRATLGDRFSIAVRAESAARVPPPGLIEITDFDGSPTVVRLGPDGTATGYIRTPLNPHSNVVTVGFRSIAPGWQPAPPVKQTLAFAPPSRWSRAGWIAAALLVLGWFAWSRRRAVPGAAISMPARAQRPYAHVEIVESSRDPDSGWSGTVVDAHEGTPIVATAVELYRPGFNSEVQVFATQSDASGRFEIPPQPPDGNTPLRLELHAAGYARLVLTLPPPGRVRVHLVSVRRALLERLVLWAKRRGAPFDSKAEPTPDWVAETARAKGHPTIEAWAKSVSAAAFGTENPAHAELRELQPPTGKAGHEEPKRRDR